MAIEPFLGTNAQRAFLGVALLQALAILGLIAAAFGLIEDVIDTRLQSIKTVPAYFAIFGLAEIFELLLTFDALYTRNIMQLTGILAFHTGMLVYSCLQVHQTRKAIVTQGGTCYANCDSPGSLWSKVKVLLIVVPVVLGVSLILLGWITRLLYREFGWAVFHHLGADPRKKRMYRWYQIMILLIKMDGFFFIGLSLQLIILVLHENSGEFGATIAAIPIVTVLLGTCVIALKREIKWLMVICLALFCLSQAYFIFKFVRFYEPSTKDQYATTRATLTVFTIIAFLVDLASFLVGIHCFTDFDKGLRAPKTNEAAVSKPLSSPAPGTPMFERNSSYNAAPLQPRMSIE